MKEDAQIVMLEYSFLFEVPETWTNGYAFEQDLAKFLEAMGLQAKILKMVEGVNQGRRVLYITQKPKPPEPVAPPKTSNQGQAPAMQLKQMTKEYKK